MQKGQIKLLLFLVSHTNNLLCLLPLNNSCSHCICSQCTDLMISVINYSNLAAVNPAQAPPRVLQVGHKRNLPSHIPDYFPAFPDQHTYIKTEVCLYFVVVT
jgi:hypothetical protein